MYINQGIYSCKYVALSPLWKQKMQRVKITIIQYSNAHSRHKTASVYYVTVKLSESNQQLSVSRRWSLINLLYLK